MQACSVLYLTKNLGDPTTNLTGIILQNNELAANLQCFGVFAHLAPPVS